MRLSCRLGTMTGPRANKTARKTNVATTHRRIRRHGMTHIPASPAKSIRGFVSAQTDIRVVRHSRRTAPSEGASPDGFWRTCPITSLPRNAPTSVGSSAAITSTAASRNGRHVAERNQRRACASTSSPKGIASISIGGHWPMRKSETTIPASMRPEGRGRIAAACRNASAEGSIAMASEAPTVPNRSIQSVNSGPWASAKIAPRSPPVFERPAARKPAYVIHGTKKTNVKSSP